MSEGWDGGLGASKENYMFPVLGSGGEIGRPIFLCYWKKLRLLQGDTFFFLEYKMERCGVVVILFLYFVLLQHYIKTGK